MKVKFLIAVAALAGLIAVLQNQVNELRQDYLIREDRVFVPPVPNFVKIASLGYHNLVADIYWIRTIQYREICREKKQHPRDLYAMTDLLTDLDPGYCLAYFYSGMAMIDEGEDQHNIIALLTKGSNSEHCSGYWKNPFLLGYYYYFNLQDYKNAVQWMELACKWHDGHKLYCGLATRISNIAGEPELGLQLLGEIYNENQDPYTKDYFEKRFNELNVKITERDLTAAVTKYHDANGEYPKQLDDLFRDGQVIGTPPEGFRPQIYQEVPAHPMAEHIYIYDPTEKAVRSEPPIELGFIKPPM